MSHYGFGRQQRLLTPKHFSNVFNGKTVRASCPELLLIALPHKDSQADRLGFVLAKKHIRHAVDRNRIRRIGREVFRHWQHLGQTADIIVLAKKGSGELSKPQLHRLFKRLFNKIETRINGFSTQ